MDHKYKISFRIGDASFDLESTDLDWLENKEKDYVTKLLDKGGKIVKPAERNDHLQSTFRSQKLTIKEFYKNYIKANKITARPDLVVFFVYYLERILKKEVIKASDVIQCFADISYPNYNKLNVPDLLTQAKRKALLKYVNNFWSLTITGEDFVLNTILDKVQ